MHRYEAREIRRALEDAGGVISQASRLLGLTHQRLHKILKNRHKKLRDVLADILASEPETNLDSDSTGDLSELARQETKVIRILHVEDNELVAGMTQEMLELQGWTVETCFDGNVALEKISGSVEYDLLVSDYDLPGVNGLELVHRTRKLAHRARTPIIVLSASPVGAAAREAGADVFLQKPQDIGSLVETINRLLSEFEESD